MTSTLDLPMSGMPAKTLPRLSQYRVKALLGCNAWIPSRASNPAFRFGRAYHTALQLWLSKGNEQDSPQALCEIAIRDEPGFPIERTAELERMVIDYIRSVDRAALRREWDVEVEVELERVADGVAILTGRADRIDVSKDGRTVRLPDYKTNWQLAQEKEPPFQLMYYGSLAARKYLSAERFILELHGARQGSVQSWTLSVDDIEEWWERMTTRLEQVLRDEKRPTGGEQCHGCEKVWTCSAAPLEMSHVPENDDQALELVQDLTRRQAGVELLTNALKTYSKDREPFVLGDKLVGYRLSSPGVRLVDKDKALAEGIAKETRPTLAFRITRARDNGAPDAE